MRVIGLAGWSGAGKTSLLVRAIPLLVARGVRVATIKHAHHDFDTDWPGKDSYERSVVLASQAAIPHLKEGGRIISIGSCLGERVPFPGG
uniref:molybdopterin-guanine dinucleotide biosynthesis protein B n=1 Tax=Methylobacterium sp. B34 TaxID=95563 RepID=UPI001FCC054F